MISARGFTRPWGEFEGGYTGVNKIPPPNMLEGPLVAALEELGGKGHRIDVERVVACNLDIPRALAEIRHDRGNSGDDTELQYNLSWAGTALVKRGVIKKYRGIWSLTQSRDPAMEVAE